MLIASGSYSPRFICSLVAVVAVLAIGTATYHIGLAGDVLTMALWAQFDDQTQGSNSKAPGDPKVVALVFYGRREQVSILDCYLKRNLKRNGGILDEVIFAVNTTKKDDLAYLESLVSTDLQYSEHTPRQFYGLDSWTANWEAVSERDTIYIKIDDDIVFIEDETIGNIVKRLVENPRYFAVSANVVNNPALSWVHRRLGVFEPYWPEMTKSHVKPIDSWRASELPTYDGPLWGPDNFDYNGSTPAPYPRHRWLPVRPVPGESYHIDLFPAQTLTYEAFGPSLWNWAAGAQTHYSFLQHLEQGDTAKYKFDTWDYDYERLSINFFAIRGRDVLDAFPWSNPDDEDYLTVVRSKELGRHVVVDGTGIAAHFSFWPQRDAHDGRGLAWTDVLDRYRAYAQEMVCPFENMTG